MKIKKNIALSDSGFVFDPANGNSFTTNPIGLQLIQLLKQGRSDSEITAEMVSMYEVSLDQAERDLFDFKSVLSKLKLTEENGQEKD
jgi:hypothetical protein